MFKVSNKGTRNFEHVIADWEGVPDTHLIHLGMMKGCADLGAN